ncbi:ROK family transcriptional regulator [Nucisporomicrobium flavum]|uniref:ROK family transcriptional regulator n=1 Tax=Nucisporomicrobium flavum TaxID=2785915 RepID=UPI003C2BB48C
MRAAPGKEDVRRHNLGTVLRYVHVHGATSRAELTTRLGLNRSTIGALTADLTAAGLVFERTQRDTGRAGRPSLVVRPRSATVYAYALSIEVDRLRAARVGLGGRILDRREVPRPPGMAVPEAAGPLAAFVREMAGDVPDDGRFVGTGVAVVGRSRAADGTAVLVPRQHLEDLAAGDLGVPGRLSVGNHAEVSALAEHSRGAAAGCDNVLYLYGDIGVGAGIIADGRRTLGRGGEVGHVVVNPYGRQCPCGSRGCWETEIGERALLQHAGRSGAAGREAVLGVVKAAMFGDARAQSAIREVGGWIGFGVGNLANIVNPEAVIFGGTLRDVYLAAAAHIRSRMNAVALPACREQVRLRTPGLGEDAALIGAAELAFERLLGDPLVS